MRYMLLALISVILSSLAQVSLKYGTSSPGIRSTLTFDGAKSIANLVRAILDPWIALGLFLYAVGALIWLPVLARLDLSKAYPLVGLAFVLTTIFAMAFLGERPSATRLVGTALVIAGVILVARS